MGLQQKTRSLQAEMLTDESEDSKDTVRVTATHTKHMSYPAAKLSSRILP
jgi:hypothetical protein